jgi:hypothetical protein
MDQKNQAFSGQKERKTIMTPFLTLRSLRARLSSALLTLLFCGLALPVPNPRAFAAVAAPLVNKGSTLTPGQVLSIDDHLLSPNGRYAAVMQSDGNFVLYHGTPSTPGSAYWATQTVFTATLSTTIVAGNNQKVALSNGVARFAPLQVKVLNACQPASGVRVGFNGGVVSPPLSIIQIYLNGHDRVTHVTTDSNGLATVILVVTGNITTQFQIDAIPHSGRGVYFSEVAVKP